MADQEASSSQLKDKATNGGFLSNLDLGSLVSSLSDSAKSMADKDPLLSNILKGADDVKAAILDPVNNQLQLQEQRHQALRAAHPTLAKAEDVADFIVDGINTATTAGGVPGLHTGALLGIKDTGPLYHGVRDDFVTYRNILKGGFGKNLGKNFETGVPGTSLSEDLTTAVHFANNVPGKVLAVELPDEVRSTIMNVDPETFNRLVRKNAHNVKQELPEGLSGMRLPNHLMLQHETVVFPEAKDKLFIRSLRPQEHAQAVEMRQMDRATHQALESYAEDASPANTVGALKKLDQPIAISQLALDLMGTRPNEGEWGGLHLLSKIGVNRNQKLDPKPVGRWKDVPDLWGDVRKIGEDAETFKSLKQLAAERITPRDITNTTFGLNTMPEHQDMGMTPNVAWRKASRLKDQILQRIRALPNPEDLR